MYSTIPRVLDFFDHTEKYFQAFIFFHKISGSQNYFVITVCSVSVDQFLEYTRHTSKRKTSPIVIYFYDYNSSKNLCKNLILWRSLRK